MTLIGTRRALAVARPWWTAPPFLLDGVAPTLAADLSRGRTALAGRDVGFSDLFALTSGSKWVVDGSATWVQTPAGEPAHDWSFGRRRLLLEGTSTNVCTWSSRFDGSSAWVPTGLTVPAPDGAGWTAMRETAVSSGHYHVWGSVSTTAGQTWTVSAIVRTAGRRHVALRSSIIGSAYVNVGFDLVAGTVTWAASGWTGRIRLIGGFAVIEASATVTTAGSAGVRLVFGSSAITDDLIPSYTGDAVFGVDVRHVQVEQAPGATSPIVTTGAAVTRVTDQVPWTSPAFATLTGAGATLAWRGRVGSAVSGQQLCSLGGSSIFRSGAATPSSLVCELRAGSFGGALGVIPGEIGAVTTFGTGRAYAVNGVVVGESATPPGYPFPSAALGAGSGLTAGSVVHLDEIVVWPVERRAAYLAQARAWS